MAVHSPRENTAEENNVYLLQTTLDRICKAARKVTACIDEDGVMDIRYLDKNILALRKALTAR